MIYEELVLDSSTANHPDTVQRNCAVFLGAEGLVANFRHLNPGRLGNKYKVFFTQMKALIKES